MSRRRNDELQQRQVFREMGIEDRWILTPGSEPGAIAGFVQ